MSGQLTCQVETGSDIFAVRPRGSLDLAAASMLRGVLLKAMAESPLAIVLDLARLSVVDDICLTMLAAIAQRAAGEPSTALLLYGADPGVSRSLATLGIDRYVPVCPSRDDAIHRAMSGSIGGRLTRWYPGVPDSVPTARRLIADMCERWQIPPTVTRKLLVITTELVTNAVCHARTPLQLVLRRSPRYVHVAVLDGDERPARLRGPDTPTSSSGRGLMLVEAFASAWGCHPTANGKSTWATIRYRAMVPSN